MIASRRPGHDGRCLVPWPHARHHSAPREPPSLNTRHHRPVLDLAGCPARSADRGVGLRQLPRMARGGSLARLFPTQLLANRPEALSDGVTLSAQARLKLARMALETVRANIGWGQFSGRGWAWCGRR